MTLTSLSFGLWVLVQFWCGYSTVPLNVIIIQMWSRCKKALIAESVRDSLHSWCKRLKARSKLLSIATRSVCSVESTIDEIDEDMTVASGTISPTCSSSSAGTLNQLDHDNDNEAEEAEGIMEDHNSAQHEYSFRVSEYLSQAIINVEENIVDGIEEEEEEGNSSHPDTLFELFRRPT